MDTSKYEKAIDKELFITTPLFLIAILIPILAGHGFLRLDEGNNANWFQRSRSLVVIIAVWIEFKLFKIDSLCSPRSDKGKTLGDFEIEDFLVNKYSGLITKLKYIAAFMAIMGTLIWGYGDLLFK